MPAPKVPVSRSDSHSWLITGPLFLLGALLSLPILLSDRTYPVGHLGYALALLALATLATPMELRFDIRRQALVTRMNDIPVVLALFYLSPWLAIVVRVTAGLLWNIFGAHLSGHKLAFNAASHFAGIATANLIVFEFGLHGGGSPATWLVLAAAVLAGNVVTLAAIAGVMVLLQGVAQLPQFLKSSVPGFAVMGVNIVLGLVMLLTLVASQWGALLLVALAVVLFMLYRSYAQFFRQHRNLTEIYALTRDIAATNHDGTLPDVLLGRVRALLAGGVRDAVAARAGPLPRGAAVAPGSTTPACWTVATTPDRAAAAGDAHRADRRRRPQGRRRRSCVGIAARPASRTSIVVPLRSSGVAIGTLEVAGRLGDTGRVRQGRRAAARDARRARRRRGRELAGWSTGSGSTPTTTRSPAWPTGAGCSHALEEAMKGRAPGEVVAVLLFDVDGLREVNESLGHDAGDEVLVQVAPAGCARWHRSGAWSAGSAATSSRSSSAPPAPTPPSSSPPSCATGLRRPMVSTRSPSTSTPPSAWPSTPTTARSPRRCCSGPTWPPHAAKSPRRSSSCSTRACESRSVRRLGLAADLRRALDTGELEVYFQPKVALKDRRLVGVECLARWEHPVHGQVAPADFVSVAEHTGQLARLNDVVLREGLRRARDWADAGRPLTVAVNLSARTLIDPTSR